jgi:hypothetical protein
MFDIYTQNSTFTTHNTITSTGTHFSKQSKLYTDATTLLAVILSYKIKSQSIFKKYHKLNNEALYKYISSLVFTYITFFNISHKFENNY